MNATRRRLAKARRRARKALRTLKVYAFRYVGTGAPQDVELPPEVASAFWAGGSLFFRTAP